MIISQRTVPSERIQVTHWPDGLGRREKDAHADVLSQRPHLAKCPLTKETLDIAPDVQRRFQRRCKFDTGGFLLLVQFHPGAGLTSSVPVIDGK